MGAVINPFGAAFDVIINAAKEVTSDKAKFSFVNVFDKIMEPFAFFFFDPNLVNRFAVEGDADRSVCVFNLEDVAALINLRDILTAFDHLDDNINRVLLRSAFLLRQSKIWH